MARRHSPSRAVTWLVLATYVLVASGVPLPASGERPAATSPAAKRLADKDRSRPFPCMDKPCGCTTAEQCFANCCCNTPTELLAWAKAHRLEPTTLAMLQSRIGTSAAAKEPASCCSSSRTALPCCSDDAADVCDEYQSLAAEPMAAAEALLPIDTGPREEDSRPPERVRMISLKAMLACGGVLTGWSAAMTSLPPPATIRCEPAVSLVAVLTLADDLGLSVDLLSDTPPPRA